MGLIDTDAGVLRSHHGPGVADEVRVRFADPPLDAPLAFTDAARTGVPVLIQDHGAFLARYPESATSTTALGLGARAALPLRGSDGAVVGSIVHAWPGPRMFDETLVSTLMTIADMAGQALERTGLSEAEHRLVTTLQDSVLVPLPDARPTSTSRRATSPPPRTSAWAATGTRGSPSTTTATRSSSATWPATASPPSGRWPSSVR